MSDKSDEESAPKRRRGVSNTETYKRNTVRNARVTGQGYVSYSGKEVQSKVKPETLSCKCPAKCFLSIDEKVIDDNWSYFYSLETKNAQDTYIQTLVEAREVKRRKKFGQDIHNPETSENGQTFKRNHTYLLQHKEKWIPQKGL